MSKKALTLFLLIPYVFFAQENTFYHYGLKEGLSQESVQTILKDNLGFIWLGTQEGLNRFDGSSFKIYKNDFESPNTLSGNNIKKLLEFKNYIFIGTNNNGICYYDKTTNKFHKTTLTNGSCTGLIKFNNTVYTSILNEGLFKITINKKNVTITKVVTNLPNNITAIFNTDDTIYVGTNNGMIHYALESTLDFNSQKITEETESIKTFYYDSKSLWIGTTVGLFKHNTISQNTTFVNLKKHNITASKKISINKIIYSNSIYYIASDNGLHLLKNYNIEKQNFEEGVVYKGDKNNINSITSNRVYDFVLYHNILWIGTNKLDVLTLNEPVFKSITIKSKPFINNSHIYSILKTNDYLFIGTRNGLNCIDKNGKTTIITKENTNNALAYNVIRGITKDNNNNLWLATTKGVSVISLLNFDPNKPKITSFYHDNKNNFSLSHNNTRSIFIDNQNKIWITTYGGGINLFTGNLTTNNIKFKHFKNENTLNSLSSDFVFSINQTTDNSYWISTENGLNKLFLNENTATFTNFTKGNTFKTSSIYTTLIDTKNENILWVGTDIGLYKFDIITNKAIYYGAKNGLTNTVVYSILEDSKGNLWISTNSGIFQFNKSKEYFTNYTTNDGLSNVEFNLGAKYIDKKKQLLYFGGTNGLNYFSIDNLKNLYHEGNLLFTQLKVKEQEINPLGTDKILTKNIINAKIINLKHNDFPTKLKFADLNFDYPKSSNFIYKLLPNDQDWNPLDNSKEIQFLNLSSGSYKLLVQGRSNTKLWNKNPLEINIFVAPAWYKSNFANTIYGVLTLGLLFLFYRFQLEKKLKHQEVVRLKELNNFKTKLYANITHEFRTPITVILGMADSIKEQLNSPKKISKYVDLINRNSNNLLQLVNQILDLAKLEKGKIKLNLEFDNIVNHIKYLTESFASYADEKGVSVIFYNEISKLIIPFDKDKINKIISNLLSNAIKFSKQNAKIIVYLRQINNELIIEVKDNGIGISKDNIPFIFDRFYQVKNTKDNNTGTGIGLALTKELVELMQGTINVTSIEKVETVFTIKLPINLENNLQTVTSIAKNNDIIIDADKPIALIVEDNKDVATYIKICLEKNYQILTAINGNIGIELALTHMPDIIISDVMMPIKNGFELCKILKNDIKTSHIPIILLTAKNSQESKIEGLSHGADAYLTKPFNKEELLIRIEKLIVIRALLANKYKNIDSLKLKENSTDKNDIFINKAITNINKNIDSSEFNAKQLADNLFLSESQLYRKLKALTNTSTALFIRKIKLQKAKQLLKEGKLNISEVCYATGFNNPSWFSKVFKEEFGFSPSKN